MKKILFLFFLLMFHSSSHAELNSAETVGKVITISQRIGLPEYGYIQTFKAKLGGLAVNKAGMLVTTQDGEFSPNDYVAEVPKVTINPGMTQDEILDEGKINQGVVVISIINQLKSLMTEKGAIQVNYSYSQKVPVAPSNREKILNWNILIDSFGRARYSAPKLLALTPEYTYAAYTPLKHDEALFTNFPAYNHAGTMELNVFNHEFSKIKPQTFLNVSGAYDQPRLQQKPYTTPYDAGCDIEAGEMSCDVDFKLRCMINKNVSSLCPNTAFVDVITQINKDGTEGAYVDYIRGLSPAYNEVDSGARDEDGDIIYDQVPIINVNVKSRTWTTGKTFFFIAKGGGASFNMIADIGYKVMQQVDRYFVNPDGSFNQVDQLIVESQAPTSTVNKSVSVGKVLCTSFYHNVIDPFETNTVYDYRNDTVNGLPLSAYYHVAPLTCY